MVHFLEHMLFLGTKKYPQPGAYQQYLSSHGGYSNAYTADEHTNYFFSVSHNGYEGALDRFAHFFIAPSFDQQYAEREVNAVASEHSKNLESDYWRVLQVQRGVYEKDHPINRFSTGNLETLAGVGNAELRTFYRRQYSSNRMALALVSNRGLDELERLVKGRFDQVPNRGFTPHRYPETYLKSARALRVLSVEPIRDQRSLVIEFPLPPTRQLYRSKPLRLLSSVLGHEGEGSLLSLLKAEDLAATLSAGHGQSTGDYSSFSMRIGLTPRGLQRYTDVLEITLGVINGLKTRGMPRHIFEENRTMADINYRYRERQGSASLARGMTALMRVYPLKELPEAPFKLTEFDPRGISELLQRMRPENMLVTLIAKGLKSDRVEPYYKTPYEYRETTGRTYARMVRAKPDGRWHLPSPNPYIPRRVALSRPSGPLKMSDTAFRHLRKEGVPPKVMEKLEPLRGTTFTGADALLEGLGRQLSPEDKREFAPRVLKDSLAFPVKLMDTAQAKVWYLADWRYRQPKAEMLLKFYTGSGYGTPREAILARLYEAAMEESLTEYGYPIRVAGLSFGIKSVKAGIELALGGYSANMLTLLQDLGSRLKEVNIDEKTFASIKERMGRSLKNAKFAQPFRQARYFRNQLLVVPNFSRDALERELEAATLPVLRGFAARLYDRVYLQGVVLGNLAPAAAASAVRRMLGALEAKVLPEAQRLENEVRVLPRGSNYVFTDRLRINNSFGGMYYQVGRTNPRLRGAALVISRPLREKFYFNMRTEQQLGYIVYASMGQIKKTLSFNFLVQSGAHPADRLLARMKAYIPKFVDAFGRLSGEQFEKYRKAVIEAKLRRSKNLSEAAERLFWIAFENDEKFDHVSEDIRAVEALTREEVEEILHNFLIGRGKRRLSIRLIGKDHPKGRPRGRPISLPPETQAKAG